MFSAEQLLNPISDTQPAGDDLAFSPELDAITLARKFDDPSLDQGEWVTELKEADWGFVVQRCAALLEKNSKDLRLAVWLTEAGAKKHHLRGLGEGLRVLAGLCDDYWDLGLYPEADDGDQDQRIGNLSWILARIPALLREIPLTESGAYSTIDFEVARKHASQNENGRPPANGVKLSDMDNAKRNNSVRFCAAFTADAQYCIDALQQLEQATDARLGQDSPGFSAAREALQDMLRLMPAAPAATLAAAPAASAHPSAPAATHGSAAAMTSIPAGPPGAIHTRAQAIDQLRAVARFFRQTEPHSPVSYFADKAANAADQDLHSWLRSVVKDPGSLAHIEELLGVQPPPGQH
ncbi:type VI secretion system protein TssA [Janthinobacterium agaricidamnosum]|uniref:ImpA-related N-terminal family protein n=1 Tax=Janthinobacterium agaricidamnosum NBRC 102515 = DSM 9628 TaxID=1349767 RepID=W0V2W9_9BURK|nr:type VI secretion system protein TssA [Janthinobacterium agaricidamnosum]CDG83179.1 impA-related N-terminal family protein [Janthinobacterium agaricidamnosum NBRC 102515 = DSM 9628]